MRTQSLEHGCEEATRAAGRGDRVDEVLGEAGEPRVARHDDDRVGGRAQHRVAEQPDLTLRHEAGTCAPRSLGSPSMTDAASSRADWRVNGLSAAYRTTEPAASSRSYGIRTT